MDRRAFLGLVTLALLTASLPGRAEAAAELGTLGNHGKPHSIGPPGGVNGVRHGGGMGRERPSPARESARGRGDGEGLGGFSRRDAVGGGRDRDDRRIRAAVRRGEAEPLRKILSVVRKRYDGRIVRITLGGRGSALHYRIRILGADDRLIEVKVNARTASILSVAGL